MKKSAWLGIIILIVLIALILIPYLNNSSSEKLNSTLSRGTSQNNQLDVPINTQSSTSEVTNVQDINIVEITSQGFSPLKLEINQGEKVRWINKQSQKSWPASAIHPSHKAYPNSDINKCGTEEQTEIFDTCRGLAEGEAYEFTFTEIGSWNYHDHLNARWRGEIAVS